MLAHVLGSHLTRTMKLSALAAACLTLQSVYAAVAPTLDRLSIIEHPNPAKRTLVQNYVRDLFGSFLAPLYTY